MKKARGLLWVHSLLVASLATVQAATVTWNGTGDMIWSQPDTNSFTATYNSGDTARFTATGGGTVAIAAGGVTPAQIIMYSPRGANTFTFSLGENNALGTGSFDSDYNVSTTFNNTKGTGSANEVTLANSFIYTNGYTLRFTGGDIRLTGTVSSGGNGGPSINPAAGVTVTLDNGFSGTSDFTLYPDVAGSTVRINGTSTANAYQVRQVTILVGADNVLGPVGSTPTARQAVTGNGTVFEAVGGARILNNNFYSRGFTVQGANNLTMNGAIQNNEGYWVYKLGFSTLTLNGNNSAWGNNLVCREGVVRAGHANALGTSGIRFSGGVLELGAADFTWPLSTNPWAGTSTVGWITDGSYGASGGFSAYGGNRSVNLGNAGAGVTWGSGGFVASGQTLIFGSTQSNAQLDFQNPINLNGAVRTIGVNDNSSSAADQTLLSGLISNSTGTSGLTKTGAGRLVLSNNNTYNGLTTVSEGTLLVNGTHSGGGTYSVASGATLGGSGSLSGLVTVAGGGHLAPGTSPGTLTLTSGLSLTSGAVLDFELGQTGADLIRVSSGTFTGSSGSGGVTVNLTESGVLNTGDYTLINWLGATASGVDAADFVAGSGPNRYSYSFSIVGSELVMNAIPEPAALGLLALGGMLCLRRRR